LTQARNRQEGILLHDILFAPFFSGAAGGGQIWHWDSYVAPNNLWFQFGRFAQVVQGLDPPAEGFEPVMAPHERLRVYVLKGRHTVLAWCRDTRNTWESELKNGEKPETLRGMVVNLSKLLPSGKIRSKRVYDPWADRWSDLTLKNGKAALPDFSRSVVIRIER